MAPHASTTIVAMSARPCRGLALVALAATLGCGGGATLPDATHTVPFGFVDVPVPGASVARVTRVAGWALDDGAVRRVDVYVDGRFVGSATPALARPDVAAAFPDVPGSAQSGWELPVDVGEAHRPHELLVQAVDDRGATRDIGVIPVTVVPRP